MTRAKLPGRRRTSAAAALLCLLAATVGCEYLKWAGTKKLQRKQYRKDPSLLLEKELAPENCFSLIGHVVLPGGGPHSVLVVALDHSNPSHPVVAQREVTADSGYYGILLPAGSYDVLLFADVNENGFYETDELVARTPPASPVLVDEKHATEGVIVPGPDLALDLRTPGVSERAVRVKVSSSPFVVTSLDEPIFAPELGELGVYYPTQFLARVQRWVFAVGEPDFKKAQVVLVHGIKGTPRDFSAMLAGIDRSRYQIWLFYYPSGLRLDNLGIVLSHAVETIAAYPESPDFKLVLVAHSMGGLVGRRAVNELCRNGRPSYLKAYVSFDTPYGGVERLIGREGSGRPLVASWRDVAADSNFIKRLYARPIPPDLPFFLFFGWGLPGANGPSPAGDGTIALRSQLDPRAQAAARRMIGFGQTHVGILSDKDAIHALSEILDETTGAKTAAVH